MSKIVNEPLNEKLIENRRGNHVAINSGILVSSPHDIDNSKVKPYNDPTFLSYNNATHNDHVDDYGHDYNSIRDDHSAVYWYLKRYFIELTWIDILKVYIINTGSIVFNIVFICYNFSVICDIDSTKQFNNKEIRYSDIIVVYFEFIGLVIIFLSCVFTCCIGNYSAMCDFIPSLGNFSAFKLFYQFRPMSIIDYMTDVYQNNNSNDNTSTIARSILVFRTIWLFLMFLICLLVGFLSLLIKLSQLSFINDKWFYEYSKYEIIYLLGFSNQLWNMANENKIVVNSILEFLYIDSVSFSINRDSQIKIMTMEAIIKQTLVKVHGIRGLLVSIGLNHKLLCKMLKTIPHDQTSRQIERDNCDYKPDRRNHDDKRDSRNCNNISDSLTDKLDIESDSKSDKNSTTTHQTKAVHSRNTHKGFLAKLRALSSALRNRFRQKMKKLKNYLNFEMFFPSKYKSQCEIISMSIKREWINHNRSNDLIKQLKQNLNINISLNRFSHASCLFDWIAMYGLRILGVICFIFVSSCAVMSTIIVAFGDRYDVKKNDYYDDNTNDELHKCVHNYGGSLWSANCWMVALSWVLLLSFIGFFRITMNWLQHRPRQQIIKYRCDNECCKGLLIIIAVEVVLLLGINIVLQIIAFSNLLTVGLSNHNSADDNCWRYLNDNYSLLVIVNAWSSTVIMIMICHFIIFVMIVCVVKGLLMLAVALFAMVSFTCSLIFDWVWIGELIIFASEWDEFHASSLSIMNQYSACNFMLDTTYAIFVLYMISIACNIIRFLWTWIYISHVGLDAALQSTVFVKYYKFTTLFINYIIYGLSIILSWMVLISIYVFSNEKKSYCYQYWKNGHNLSYSDPFTQLTSASFIFILTANVSTQTIALICLWIMRKVDDSKSDGVIYCVHLMCSHSIEIWIFMLWMLFLFVLPAIITCGQCDIVETFAHKMENIMRQRHEIIFAIHGVQTRARSPSSCFWI